MQINSQATKIKLIWMINWVELDELQINPILKIKKYNLTQQSTKTNRRCRVGFGLLGLDVY